MPCCSCERAPFRVGNIIGVAQLEAEFEIVIRWYIVERPSSLFVGHRRRAVNQSASHMSGPVRPSTRPPRSSMTSTVTPLIGYACTIADNSADDRPVREPEGEFRRQRFLRDIFLLPVREERHIPFGPRPEAEDVDAFRQVHAGLPAFIAHVVAVASVVGLPGPD